MGHLKLRRRPGVWLLLVVILAACTGPTAAIVPPTPTAVPATAPAAADTSPNGNRHARHPNCTAHAHGDGSPHACSI